MSKRNYSITRKEGEWYNAEVTDSYDRKYQNYFETASEANEWVYWVWSEEDWFHDIAEDMDKLLANAIHDCKQIDKESGRRAIL